MKKLKVLTLTQKKDIEAEVKMMLHAHRDTLRNLYRPKNFDGTVNEKCGYNPKKVSFSCNEGYYGEAFGIMRGLQVMGYGYFGPDNLHALELPIWDRAAEGKKATVPEHNLKWWFSELSSQVLAEENFKGNHHCDYCLNKYHKDDVRTTTAGGNKIIYKLDLDEKEKV